MSLLQQRGGQKVIASPLCLNKDSFWVRQRILVNNTHRHDMIKRSCKNHKNQKMSMACKKVKTHVKLSRLLSQSISLMVLGR
jgi:hypothetical protein